MALGKIKQPDLVGPGGSEPWQKYRSVLKGHTEWVMGTMLVLICT